MAASRPVRALRWWTAPAMAQLHRQLEGGWAAWCNGWGFERAAVACANACESSQAYSTVRHWQQVGALDGDGVWIGIPDADPAHWLQQGTFAAGPERQLTPVARRVVTEAWQDLQREISRALVPEAQAGVQAAVTLRSALPAGHRLPWSGAVAGRLSVADGRLGALVVHVGPVVAAGHCVAARSMSAPAPTAARLTSVADALGHRQVMLDVHLGAAEIELGMLQSLRVGDVVVLSHALDEPASVRWTDTEANAGVNTADRHRRTVLFEAHLGRLGPVKAIEAVPPRTPATQTH